MAPRVRIPHTVLQIGLHVVTIVTGFCTFLPLGNVSNYFLSQCVLYSNVKVTVYAQPEGGDSLFLDAPASTWGDKLTCDFTTYVAVVAAIHSFIWCWFHILLKSEFKEESGEFTILFPSFVLNSILCVATFVSSSMVSAGQNEFCDHLQRGLHQQYSCKATESLKWDIFTNPDKTQPYFTFLLIAKISSWLMTISILLQCILCGVKMFTGFLGDDTKGKSV